MAGDVPPPRASGGRYGVGMLAGVIVIKHIRKWLCSVPGLGVVLAPVTALMPLSLVGAAAGAATVYCLEEGDARALQTKLLPRAKKHIQQAHRCGRPTAGC